MKINLLIFVLLLIICIVLINIYFITNNEHYNFIEKNYSNVVVFLISHENSNTGAPLYLYNLEKFFIKNNIKTELLLLNKFEDKNLIIQHGIKVGPNDIEKYILDKCEAENITPIIICNTICTYEYLLKLSHLKLNIIWIIHEWLIEDYFSHLFDKIIQIENANIIFLCNGQKNNNDKYFNSNNNRYVITNGFDPLIFKEQQDNKINLIDKIKINNPIIISIIGTIDKRKNQQDFIDNVFNVLKNKYTNLVLVLVGQGHHNLKINKNSNSIILTGLVNNAMSYINESDIIVSHSLNEVLPTNIIEAMFCSKPIVSSNAGCSSSEVINDVNGYIYYNNNECIKYLSMLIEDKEKRELMGLNSNKLFYQNFTKANYNKFFDIFDIILQNNN